MKTHHENLHEKTEHIQQHNKTDKKKIKTIQIAAVLIAGIAIAFIVAGYLYEGKCKSVSATITQEQASEKALNYINSVLEGQAFAKLISINESGDIYNLKIDINGRLWDSFITKDGKFLFPSGIDLEAQTSETKTSTPKSDKPKAELFVMSFCPYGVQAESYMKPVVDLLGNKAEIKVRFIAQSGESLNSVQSLHGLSEAKEDLRQLCIMKNYPEKYWNYLTVFNKNCYPIYMNETALDSCWKNSATGAGIDATKIESCVSSDGLALIKADGQAAGAYGVSGSPTLIINGAIYNGQRSPEDFKNAICSAFNNPPSECSQKLGSASQNVNQGGCG